MIDLLRSNIKTLEGNTPALEQDEIDYLHTLVPGWQLCSGDHEQDRCLKRSFVFANYAEALAFCTAIGEVSLDEGHTPRMTVDNHTVTMTWRTTKLGGLHYNDFSMAAKVDDLYKNWAIITSEPIDVHR